MTEVRPQTQPWVRWAGVLCLAGVLFLLQELLRTLLYIGEAQSTVNSQLGGTGWLDMSGAATPAALLYVVAHLWIFLFAVKWRRWPGIGLVEWIVFGLLGIGIIAVHVIVLGPLRDWIIRPRLL